MLGTLCDRVIRSGDIVPRSYQVRRCRSHPVMPDDE